MSDTFKYVLCQIERFPDFGGVYEIISYETTEGYWRAIGTHGINSNIAVFISHTDGLKAVAAADIGTRRLMQVVCHDSTD